MQDLRRRRRRRRLNGVIHRRSRDGADVGGGRLGERDVKIVECRAVDVVEGHAGGVVVEGERAGARGLSGVRGWGGTGTQEQQNVEWVSELLER